MVEISTVSRMIEETEAEKTSTPPPMVILQKYPSLFHQGTISGRNISIVRLAEKMLSDPFLAQLNGVHARYGEREIRLPIVAFAEWLWHAFVEKRSSAYPDQMLSRLLTDNSASAVTTMIVAGPNIDGDVRIGSKVALGSYEDLPIEVKRAIPLPANIPAAQLSTEWIIRPLLVLDGHARQSPNDWWDGMAMLHDIRRCLTLFGPCASEIAGMRIAVAAEQAPQIRNVSTMPLPETLSSCGYRTPKAVQATDLKPVLEAWLRLKPEIRNDLTVCLERLSSAILGRPIEQAIDLGIALESLLVGDESSELSYRIAVRGATLGERDPAKRLQCFYLLRALYALRSQAVHRGRISEEIRLAPAIPKQKSREVLLDGLKLCANLCSEVIMRGGKPDFDKVVLSVR